VTVNFTSSDTNYNDASGSGSIVINKATPTIAVTGGTSTYNGSAHPASATATGIGGASVSGTFAFTYTPPGNSTAPINAGSYAVKAGFTSSDVNYGDVADSCLTCSASITITKATATCTVTGFSGTYDGLAHGATGSCTGVGGPSDVLTGLSIASTTYINVPGGLVHWTFTNNNYVDQSGDATVTINKADATINVVGFTDVYDGNAHGATGTATGVGSSNLNASLNLGATFTNVPGGTANWSFTGGTNYNDQNGTAAIVINKANAICTVNGYTGNYAGAAHGATGSCTGVGGATLAGLNLGASFTNVPGGTAHWTFAGGTNYNDASGDVAIVINKADATIYVGGYSGVYDGNPHGASGTAIGVGGANLSASLNLGESFINVPGGTANWTFSGGTNYNDKSGSVAIVITTAFAYDGFYAPISGYGGSPDNPVKAFKLGSTIPVKFGATWLNSGAAVIDGTHTLQVLKYSSSTLSAEAIDATPTDSATTGNQFRLSGTEWHFNLSTKGLTAGTWLLRATLQDGSQHTVWITLKK
jgi:hypothetical protein